MCSVPLLKVVPTEYGTQQHPLFCFRWSTRQKGANAGLQELETARTLQSAKDTAGKHRNIAAVLLIVDFSELKL
jgi:hypothetical protein